MRNNKYTASEAIQCIDGIHKKRFYEMMKNGEISYTLESWGNKTRRIIEASELVRVFGNKFILETKQETVSETKNKLLSPAETSFGNNGIIEFLKNQLEYERTERKLEQEQALEREKYLRSQNEKLTDTINKQTLFLEDMRQKSDKPKETEPRKKFLGIF